mmetsp:Transcript_26852/g.36898  ORF Transcript_26852/g.36898 Transcript_26852/m.36898 type:complete len:121 (-) Transcript_26852:244-606(-)
MKLTKRYYNQQCMFVSIFISKATPSKLPTKNLLISSTPNRPLSLSVKKTTYFAAQPMVQTSGPTRPLKNLGVLLHVIFFFFPPLLDLYRNPTTTEWNAKLTNLYSKPLPIRLNSLNWRSS